MAIDLTDGYIYFVESNSDNDDWITDHAGDPDSLDLTNYTEGTEYCKLKMPERFVKSFVTGMIIVDSGGGNSYQERYERRSYSILSEGIETSIYNADLVEKFFTIPRHTAASNDTYKEYYLIIRFGASNYVNFTDNDGNRKEYCRGAVLSGSVTWSEAKPSAALVKLTFKSIWN